MGGPLLDGRPPSGDAESLVLPDVAPGGRSSARIWVHNTTSSSASTLRPWATGVTNHAGRSLLPEAVTFDPERVERVDPGESRALVAMLKVPPDATPGSYHGLVLIEGLPDVALPVLVRVVPSPEAPGAR
jgi:hypothetical protein